MRSILVFLVTILLATTAYAERVTEAVVVGVGSTQEAALQNAFENGMKQLRGTYIATVEKFKGDTLQSETIALTQGKLDQYKILDSKTIDGLVYLNVYLTVHADDPLKKLLNYGYKGTPSSESVLNMAAFQQTRLANAQKIIDVMFEPEFFWSNAYQFKVAGAPVVDNVGPNSTEGYVPVLVGRNPTFWLEVYDLLKAVESRNADSSYGWYSSALEEQLWATEGQSPLPYDVEQRRLLDNVNYVATPKEIRDSIKPSVVTLSFPDSYNSLRMYFDRNMMIAGFDPFDISCKWFLGDRKFVPTWFLSPRWTDIAFNKHVDSAPPGSALYISPGSEWYGSSPNDVPFMNHKSIYGDTELIPRPGEDLVAFRTGIYQNWGDDLPVATTGLGFVVKVPFKTSNPAGLMSQIEKLQIREESGAKERVVVTM